METNIINELLNGKTVAVSTEDDFLSSVKEIEKSTKYSHVKISEMNFAGDEDNIFKSEAPLVDGFTIDCGKSIGKTFNCLTYAVKTACDRLGISGPVLSRFSNKKLANILNQCSEEYKNDEEVLIVSLPDSDNNCCIAVLSDGYRVLPANEVFKEASGEIKNLGGYFTDGYINTDIFYALYQINNKELENIYKDKFEELSKGVPMISIETSNTGLSSVSITPKFRMRDIDLIIGRPFKTLHKGESDIDSVKEDIKQIFPMFKEAIDGLSRLKKIRIENPLFCFKNIAKKVLLPKKYSMMAADDFCNFIDDSEITAYDIYFALAEVVFYAENDNRPKLFLNNLQEQIARALYLDFSKYDTPYSDWK